MAVHIDGIKRIEERDNDGARRPFGVLERDLDILV
jgi:hypothetical protein